MEAAMLGLVARGTYVVVLATMIVAWVVSFNKEASLDTQPSQATWHMYS
jgi:hypothetical protein